MASFFFFLVWHELRNQRQKVGIVSKTCCSSLFSLSPTRLYLGDTDQRLQFRLSLSLSRLSCPINGSKRNLLTFFFYTRCVEWLVYIIISFFCSFIIFSLPPPSPNIHQVLGQGAHKPIQLGHQSSFSYVRHHLLRYQHHRLTSNNENVCVLRARYSN